MKPAGRIESYSIPMAGLRLRVLVTLAALPISILCSVQAAAGDARDRLTLAEMFNEAGLGSGPIDNKYFVPMGDFGPAIHDLSATLIIPETEVPTSRLAFPAASVQLFRSGDRLVPANREIIRGGGKARRWSLIFSPGRVWCEPGDGGFSRASFPFALAHTTWNKAHNGIATFLYDHETVSPLVFQIVQETSPRHKFDAWGHLQISLNRGWFEDRDSVMAEYARELDARLPVRSLLDLAKDYGDRGQEALRAWPEGPNESVSGLLVDGVIYVGKCQTRYGPYPYCDEMRHGVFSMTKSLSALLALLRLARQYDDRISDFKIKDYLDITATHDGWDEVTFGDALNMATGIGDAPLEPMTFSEDGIPPYGNFMARLTAQDKLAVAFTSKNYPWGPGEVARYRSIDTFVLAAAMDSFLKSREGQQANIWALVLDEVLRPIGVFHAPMMHTIEADGSRGVPILGEGIFPTFHDIAKIAMLFQSGGNYQGQQLLNAEKLQEALYQTEVRGLSLPANIPRFAGITYHMSFRHVPIELGECTVSVPKMSGWGGNRALLMPSGIVPFLVMDGGRSTELDLDLAAAANALRPECQ